MNARSVCSDVNLRFLLQADEDSENYQIAASHLDGCLDCQRRLGELAAVSDERPVAAANA